MTEKRVLRHFVDGEHTDPAARSGQPVDLGVVVPGSRGSDGFCPLRNSKIDAKEAGYSSAARTVATICAGLS
jgi:hypothetical protein